MASDVGTIGLSEDEAAALRFYLRKGDFLWVDDFWGEAAWNQWTRELSRSLPASEYTIKDVPLDDPIFHSLLDVKKVPQAMTHNTDVSNSWERETEDPEYFYQFSIDGYALGINVMLYALTH